MLTPPYSQNATSTIQITPACPSGPAADVIVTRFAVAVPSCAAGNATKPVIVSMSMASGMASSIMGGGGGMMGSATNSAGLPVFTGAAGKLGQNAGLAVLGGVAIALVL